MSKKRYTAQDIIDALNVSQGYVSKAAEYLGCTPQTLYNYRNEYKSVDDAWKAIYEARHDFAESSLAKLIKEGDTAATIFYLKTQCKQRGYVERQQQEIIFDINQLNDMSDDDIRRLAERVHLGSTKPG